MPKTPLKVSPLDVLTQEFLAISIEATPGEEFGAGRIEVERKLVGDNAETDEWTLYLTVEISGSDGRASPPYTGHVTARGVYTVHPDYPQDPERLIRITAASMLYGAVRELVSSFTARGPNGMITLPSLSFYEKPPKPKKKAG